MDSKEIRSLWEAYASVYAPQEVEEGVRDVDPEKGTAERKARLEKKRGMKMDDHPQYKKESYEKAIKANQKELDKLEKGKEPATAKRYREMKKEEVENVEELYKGKHGQSEKEYQDSRSDAGKMVSGDSKMSGSAYSSRATSSTGPNPAGGSKKPKGQGRMTSGARADLAYRKANLKKEEIEVEEGIDFKAAKRIDDARKAAREKVYKKSPSTKQKDLMKGKFRPGASDEERKSGYRDIMREKGTQPKKDGKPMFSKEELERIEAIVNSWED